MVVAFLMQTADIKDMGSVGLVIDVGGYALPPNAWTGVRNVRMRNGYIGGIGGHSSTTVPQNMVPESLQYLDVPDYDWWVYYGTDANTGAGLIKAYDGEDPTGLDWTPPNPILADKWAKWTHGWALDRLFATKEWDYPIEFWRPNDLPANAFQDMRWSLVGGATWRSEQIAPRFMRAYKEFLFAFGIENKATGARSTNQLKWSDAIRDNIVLEWEPATDNLAGDAELAEGVGDLADAQPMRDSLIIYKTHSVWACDFVGGTYVMRFRKLFDRIGAFGPNCTARMQGAQVVIGEHDIFMHDGVRPTSLGEGRVKDNFYRLIDPDYYQNTVVHYYDRMGEVWIMFPSVGSQYPDTALIWHQGSNTFTLRDLPPQVLSAGTGVSFFAPVSSTYDEQTGDYDSDPRQYGEGEYNKLATTMILCGDQGAYQMDVGTEFEGLEVRRQAERTGVDLIGHDGYAMMTRVWPQMDGTGPVQIRIGSQASVTAPIKWESPQSFTPGKDAFVNCRANGRLHAWKIESSDDTRWRLHGLKADWTYSGRQ